MVAALDPLSLLGTVLRKRGNPGIAKTWLEVVSLTLLFDKHLGDGRTIREVISPNRMAPPGGGWTVLALLRAP